MLKPGQRLWGASLLPIVLFAWLLPASRAEASAGAEGNIVWARRYDSAAHGQDTTSDVVASPDGTRVFVTGTSQRDSTRKGDYLTIAYDSSTGRNLWRRAYDGGSQDSAVAAAVSPDGARLFVTGSSQQPGSLDAVTVAYDTASGAELWSAVYDGPDGLEDDAGALTVSPNGSTVFVTGGSYANDTALDAFTVAFGASTGHELWAARYDGEGGFDVGGDIVVSPDGSAVFTSATSDEQWATIAYRSADGVQLWAARTTSIGYALPGGMVVSPDGSRVFVTGSIDGAICTGCYDMATIAYGTSTGNQVWFARYDSPFSTTTQRRNDQGVAASISPDGSRLFVAGSSQDAAGVGDLGGHDFVTIAYDSLTGEQVWARRYDGPTGGDDYPREMAVTPDGSRVVVTGVSLAGSSNIVTIAYDASTGMNVWVRRYDGPAGGEDSWPSIAVTPDTHLAVVAGWSQSGTGQRAPYDYITLAYTA